jgi:hypothetical protein
MQSSANSLELTGSRGRFVGSWMLLNYVTQAFFRPID